MAARDEQQREPSTWQSLPTSVLGRCLLAASEQHDRGVALSTCTSFTKAMFTAAAETQLTVYVESFQPGLASVLMECEAKLTIRIKRRAAGSPQASLQPLIRVWVQQGMLLPNVLKVDCEGLLLGAHPPGGLNDVFPNLEDLTLQDCLVDTTELPLLPLAGCSKLQRLSLDPRRWPSLAAGPRDQRAWLLQLQQLASLPSLTAITLTVPSYPTDFLPILAGQLTELQLKHRYGGGGGEPLVWQSAISHAAQCTSLRVLKLDSCSSEDTPTLLSSLTQLQDLEVNQLHPPTAEGTNALISTLISAPHLTRLSFDRLPEPAQSYADSPCRWQELALFYATPELLSRLPLHSLTQPLQLARLEIARSTTVAEVRAAVDNLARSQAPCVVTRPVIVPGDTRKYFHVTFNMGGRGQKGGAEAAGAVAGAVQQEASPAELLRAAGPLLPQDATWVSLLDCRVDAAVVTALQQVSPPTLKSLYVASVNYRRGTVEPSFWQQLARSFPQLDEVEVGPHEGTLSPEAVMSYFTSAALLRGSPAAVQGVPKVARITLYEAATDSWHQLVRQLQALGFEDPIHFDM